jgi:hypothetical protein
MMISDLISSILIARGGSELNARNKSIPRTGSARTREKGRSNIIRRGSSSSSGSSSSCIEKRKMQNFFFFFFFFFFFPVADLNLRVD